MTATLISLVSILVGIISANTYGYLAPRFSQGLIGNTVTGVFGSILLIKSFGRLGFDPTSIVHSIDHQLVLLFLNLLISGLGGIFGAVMVGILKRNLI